ncbi:hypothetical protein RUM43_012873 [Polyplax serrata]|uniref:Uncharacterized protein n=1 Tax=Polyplax serrata TaxID=468196 RepID=A0AAN8PIR4_POLSC
MGEKGFKVKGTEQQSLLQSWNFLREMNGNNPGKLKVDEQLSVSAGRDESLREEILRKKIYQTPNVLRVSLFLSFTVTLCLFERFQSQVAFCRETNNRYTEDFIL